MAKINSVFDLPGARFVFLRDGEKYPPIEGGWQEKGHSFKEAQIYIGNIGFLAGNGYIGLDQDNPAAFHGLPLGETLTWKTRPGRLGMIFRISDDVSEVLKKLGKKPDLAQLKLFKNGKPCGEIKLQRSYQVIPPSWKVLEDGTRMDYVLLKGSPPAQTSLQKLIDDLMQIGISFSSRADVNAARLEELGKQSRQKKAAQEKQDFEDLRARRYALAALKKEADIMAATPVGNRNDQLNRSAFALGQFVAAGALSENEVVYELAKAGMAAGLDIDEIKATIRSGLDAGSKHPRELPKAGNLIEQYKEIDKNYQKLKTEPSNIDKQSHNINENCKEIETVGAHGGEQSKEIDKNYQKLKTEVADINKQYKNINENCKEIETVGENRELEPETEIRLKAMEILRNGDPMQAIADSCGRMVLGAEKAFRKLICCKAVQSVRQSAGLHPKLSGESGSGKTWAVMTFAHHLPPEMVVKGSSSNLAAFYHNDGDQMFRILDDYQAGNETLDTIIKQTSSIFHQQYDHRTVKKQEAVTLHIGSEQTWAVTSVDSSQDIQVLNRQIPINIDDSIELTRHVNRKTIERYGKGEEQFPEDESVMICREIWRLLCGNKELIDIRIPYYERIEWLDSSNRRNPSIFMDLVIAHTAMYRYQREKDPDGYYLATEADFEAAKALFTDKDAEELVLRLTKKEREFAELLVKHPEGVTREEAAQALGVSVNRISQLSNGEKGKGGLTQKLPGFEVVDVTDSERVDEDHRRSTRKVVYRLSRYAPLAGFDAVVRLNPKPEAADQNKAL